VLSWLVASAALAADVETGFILRPEVAIDIRSDRDLEDTFENYNRLRAWAKGDLKNGRFFLEVRGEHVLLMGSDTEADWLIRPDESGWEGPIGPLRLRVGHLVERWGKLDLLSVVDVLNPRDLRAGPMTPLDWTRLPIPMAVFEGTKGWFTSETILIPFAGADRVEQRGTDWSVMRQGMVKDFTADIATWEGDSAALLGPTLTKTGKTLENMGSHQRRLMNVASAEKDLPPAFFLNGEIAQRFVVRPRGFDLGLMGGWLRSNQAQSNLDPTLVDIFKTETLPGLFDAETTFAKISEPLSTAWPRTVVVATEASTVAGPIGLRAEAMWQSDKLWRSRYFQSGTSPAIAAGLGVDYSYGSTLFLAAEARYESFLDPPTTLVLMRRQAVQVGATARLTVLADRLQVQLGGAYDTNFQDLLARPTVTYRVSDSVELGAGAVIIEGPVDPPSGVLDAATYLGGPGSYFNQNDAVTLSVAWIR
jgi:hypothetical protein